MILRPIRAATVDDAAEIARLISPLGHSMTAESTADAWKNWAEEGNSAWVVEGGESLLGVITLHRMVVLHRPQPVGRITSLAVDRTARGEGIGRALVRVAEEAAVRTGCGILEVTSHTRRTEAHPFYESLGYDRTSFRFAKVLLE